MRGASDDVASSMCVHVSGGQLLAPTRTADILLRSRDDRDIQLAWHSGALQAG